MIGENIKKYRTEKGLTQKDLSDKLFVTAQAVSRWENGEVEPSISTVNEMAKIFNISVDELLGNSVIKNEPQVVTETQYVYKDQKTVLGVCEVCNKPIYESKDIVRRTDGNGSRSVVTCKSCEQKRVEQDKKMRKGNSKSRRIKSYCFGGIVGLAWLIVGIITAAEENDIMIGVYNGIVALMAFTFISCCFLGNNFIGDVTLSIMRWGFISMPGLIFTLDLDGIIWLLTVKLLLWILQFILSIIFGILAICIGAVLSLFVYPFALRNSIVHPETVEL